MSHHQLKMNRCKNNHDHPHQGFTILEVLIALTASLLLMLGLARAYKLLGDKITERQSEMDLSSRLRDVAIRVRDELRRATCEMKPPAREAAGEGYLVYHEGPFTDTTTILGSVPHPTPRSVTFFPDSRYGDIDDYLAFTTRAKEGSPFMGFIPQGVLDGVRFMNGQMSTAEQGAYSNALGTQLVPFYSEVAEIAYWVSPEWVRNADGSLYYDDQVADGTGEFTLHPVYVDRNDDMLPDKLNLHRRVLLVRPDLNFTPAQMSVANGTALPAPVPPTWNVPTVPFLVRNGGNLQVLPLSDVTGANQAIYSGATSIVAPGLWQTIGTPAAQFSASPHWLTGLARVQQVMDLSLSRVTDSWSIPETDATVIGTYGMPTAILKANSLTDLTRPENRFGHVRIPQEVISGSAGSSMPQLALAPPHPYLIARESSPADVVDTSSILRTTAGAPTTFPHQADAAVGSAPGDTPYLNRYGRFTLKTYLRPEFNLADQVSDFGAGGTSIVRVRRGGSDIVASDVVGFNVQVFDPSAPRFVWVGRDGQPGQAGVDDDPDGASPAITDEVDELGWPGSDDELVTVNDPRIDEVFVGNGRRSPTNWNQTPAFLFSRVDRGDFVDLGYMRLAGGPMRGLFQFDQAGTDISPTILPATPAASTLNHVEEFISSFSGFSADRVTVDTASGAQQSTFPVSWENSGRMIIRSITAGHVSSFYQPVYDTWTDGYSADTFDQEGIAFGTLLAGFNYGLEVGGPAYTERRMEQITSANGTPTVNAAARNVVRRRWSSMDGTFANPGQFFAQDAGQAQTVDQGSANPIEITAPVPQPLRAIKISIRLNDFSAETIRQQTVIQEF